MKTNKNINNILDKLIENRKKEKKVLEIKEKIKDNKRNILFLIPLYGNPPAHSEMALIDLMMQAKDYYNINYIIQVDLYIPYCRCRMISQALSIIESGNQVDAIFMLDQDHLYEINDFINLTESFFSEDCDVMSAMYVYKDKSHRPVAYKLKEDNSIECLEDIKKNNGIIPVDCVGLGFCLMKPEFLKRMNKEFGYWMALDCVDNENNKYSGEDVAFFKRAKKIEAKVLLNSNVYVRHVGAAV